MKKTFIEQFESQVKITSGCLGGLFVLGVLINNLQLLELGLADFSSLQARNILIGFDFFIYIIFLYMPLLIISGVAYACIKISFCEKIFFVKNITGLLGCLVFGVTILSSFCILVGTVIGYCLPWGLPWLWELRDYRTLESWQLSLVDMLTAFRQFSEIYLYPKAVAAMIGASIPIYIFVYNTIETNKWFAKSGYIKNYSFRLLNIKDIKNILYSLLFISFIFGLVGYADEVYPNIKYGLGGGQPTMVMLEIKKEDTALTDLLGINLIINQASNTATTAPLALWYRDNEFLYLSTLFNEEQKQNTVIAIDQNIVLAIRNLKGYVKVKSGGKIIKSKIDTPPWNYLYIN